MSSGFREHASGLLVPEAISRERQVWTKAEWKALDRAIGLLDFHNIAWQMTCRAPKCKGQPMVKIPQPGGGFLLRCHHCDRVFQKAF